MSNGFPTIDPVASSPKTKPSSSRALLATATLVSIALWYLPLAQFVLYPVRLFVTLIHEGGHALMAVLTGGHVESLRINPDTSGVTHVLGSAIGLVYMSGYVGAVAFGAFCLQLSRNRNGGRQGLVILAAVAGLITALWVNPFGPGLFTFVCGVATAIVFVVAARSLPERSASFLLAFLAVQLSLNAIFDLRDLIGMTTQTAAKNDAVFMSEAYGLTPWFWALLWSAISAAIFGVSLRVWWRATK
jgi:hypothetical protein